MINRIYDDFMNTFGFPFLICVILMFPFAVWKIVDILIWASKHIDIVIK